MLKSLIDEVLEFAWLASAVGALSILGVLVGLALTAV
jgi:hypothetical protein